MAERMKRYRNVNYTKEEVFKLLELVENRKQIIDSKMTDAKMSKYKAMQWNIIETEYNMRSAIKRTAKELRYKYDSLKKDARKKAASREQLMPYTGNGTAFIAMADYSYERIGELIQCEPSVDHLPPGTDPDANDIFPNEPEDSQSPEEDNTEDVAKIVLQQFIRAQSPTEHPRRSQPKNPRAKYKILHARGDPSVVTPYSPSSSSCSEDLTTPEGASTDAASTDAAYLHQKIEALKQESAARIEAHSMTMKFAEEKHCLEMEIKRAELIRLKKEITLKDLEIHIKKENCLVLPSPNWFRTIVPSEVYGNERI